MKVALVGNQNCGKTTLFNFLTGMNAKVGNWPGVTVGCKCGKIKNTDIEIVDLPGIYSLSPYSIDEEVTRNFIFEEKPDVIINVIDSNSLERSLYLTTQLLELDVEVIVALNMFEIIEKKGIKIDVLKLKENLGTSIFKISALNGLGIEELIETLKRTPIIKSKVHKKIFDLRLEYAIDNVFSRLPKSQIHKRFVAVKLLENDEYFKSMNTTEMKTITVNLSKNYETDLEETIATERYLFIEKVKKDSVKKSFIRKSISDKLDNIVLNKWLAFPIFAIVMFLIYYLSVGVVGTFSVDLITEIMKSFTDRTPLFLENLGVPEMLISLVTKGIIPGVGSVLGFIPQLFILFMCISILEATGYMSRIAFILDKLFRKIGLSGKSLIPFIVGLGCSVPGIMGTRIIENQDEREMTSILTPFVPCSAKLPIIVLFSGTFFPDNSAVVAFSLYLLSIVVIIVSALIMKKIAYKNISCLYISEMPEYKLPSLKYIINDVFDKVIGFIKRAGSVILICSVVIWFFVSFSYNMKYGSTFENSLLAVIGNKIAWFFEPMIGKRSWSVAVSAIQGLIAKEQVVSSISIIKGTIELFTPTSAYAFMVFNLFSAPCIGAIVAMKRELGDNTKMIKAITYQTVFAWILATGIYQIGSRGDIKISFGVMLIIFFITTTDGKFLNKSNRKKCKVCPYLHNCSKN